MIICRTEHSRPVTVMRVNLFRAGALISLLMLAACASKPVVQTPAPPASAPTPARPAAPAPSPAPSPAPGPAAGVSAARSVDEYKREVALRIHAANPQWVHHERPQALLRAVIVVRVKVDASGRPSAEIMRSPDPEMSQRVLQSVRAAAPLPQPPRALATQLASVGYTETWLFNSDGRFQLRTIAQPQLGE